MITYGQIRNNVPVLMGKIRKENWGGLFWSHDITRIDAINDVAYDLFELCDGKNTVEDIIKKLMEDYEIEEEELKADITEYFINCAIGKCIKGIDVTGVEDAKERLAKFETKAAEQKKALSDAIGMIGVGSGCLKAPMKVLIEFTHNCNLRCVHCFANAECCVTEDGYLKGELTKEQWFKVIDTIYDAGVFDVFVSGGEPLIRKDIFEIMKYIHSKGMGFCLLTNATYITEDNVELLKEYGCFKVEADLDGYNAETYDMFRGVKGAFDASVKGMKVCLEHNLPIRCNVTVTNLNIGWLKEIADTAVEIGIGEVCCVPLEQGGRGDTNWEKLRIKDEEEAERLYREVNSYVKKKYGNKLHFIVPLENLEEEPGEKEVGFAAHWDPNGMMPPCGAGKYHCSVNPYGKMILCPTAGDAIKIEPNDLLTHSLSDIWNNSKTLIDIRNAMKPKCFGCKHILCEIACPLATYRKYGTFTPDCLDECDLGQVVPNRV